MIDYPKLGTPIGLGLVAILCLTLAWVEDIWPQQQTAASAFLRFALFGAGFWLLFLAIVAAANLLTWHAGNRLLEIRRALAISERTRMLDLVKTMSDAQLAFIGQAGPAAIEYIVGVQGDDYTPLAFEIRTQWGPVPVAFVRDFLSGSVGDYTPPVRTWNEGSRERDYATRLVALFTSFGWLAPATGNMPARWLNREAADRLLERF